VRLAGRRPKRFYCVSVNKVQRCEWVDLHDIATQQNRTVPQVDRNCYSCCQVMIWCLFHVSFLSSFHVIQAASASFPVLASPPCVITLYSCFLPSPCQSTVRHHSVFLLPSQSLPVHRASSLCILASFPVLASPPCVITLYSCFLPSPCQSTVHHHPILLFDC
jgi:hypothetical protein